MYYVEFRIILFMNVRLNSCAGHTGLLFPFYGLFISGFYRFRVVYNFVSCFVMDSNVFIRLLLLDRISFLN